MKFLNIYIFIFLLLLLLFNSAYSQFSPGAKQISLVHSDIASNNNAFSLFNNPAGISQIKQREIGIYYSPSPFGIKELANGFGGYCEPTSFGNFSIGAMVYGFELYKENQFIFGYASEIIDNIHFGVTVNYYNLTIKNYGNSTSINLALGAIFQFQNNFSIGFVLRNPFRESTEYQATQTNFSCGISYKVINNTTINLAVVKEIDFPFSIRAGFEYPLADIFYLRIGVQNEPDLYSGGIGINYSIFRINYAITSHHALGMTNQFDLIISF